ncbi:unnamed protein product [Wuchereria bancrofti]|nr:unnamed protein product [Wuchereria bancrofti]
MEFPLTIATLPFLKATMPTPMLDYDTCCPHAEGGRYISPEFQIGHIPDGENLEQSIDDHTVLYRPLYVCIAQQQSGLSPDINSQYLGHQIKKSASMISRNGSQMTIPERERYLKKESMPDDNNSSFDKTDYQESLLSFDYSTPSL